MDCAEVAQISLAKILTQTFKVGGSTSISAIDFYTVPKNRAAITHQPSVLQEARLRKLLLSG
jgi:hypothetical protein